MRTLTYEEFHALAMSPLPAIRSVVYWGAIWGGVQINDNFAREVEEIMADALDADNGYNGIYSGLAELEIMLLEQGAE